MITELKGGVPVLLTNGKTLDHVSVIKKQTIQHEGSHVPER